MKYLITESQLDKVIFNYLNGYVEKDLVKSVEHNGDYFFWINESAFLNNSGLLFSFWTQRGEFGIQRKLRDNLVQLFGLNPLDANQMISKWFEKTFELDVESYYIM